MFFVMSSFRGRLVRSFIFLRTTKQVTTYYKGVLDSIDLRMLMRVDYMRA